MRKARRNRGGGGIVGKLVVLLALVVIAVGVNYWKPWAIYQQQGFSGLIVSVVEGIQGNGFTPSVVEQTGTATEQKPVAHTAGSYPKNGASKGDVREPEKPKSVNRTPQSQEPNQDNQAKNPDPSDKAETKLEGQGTNAVQTTSSSSNNNVISKSLGTKEMNDRMLNVLGRLQNVEIRPNTQFSMNQWLELNKFEKKLGKEGEDIAYTASLLYEAAVKAGMEVGERHLHMQLPPYAAPGFDVYIEPVNHDLTFYNSLGCSILISVKKTIDGMPQITFEGQPVSGWKQPQINVETKKYAPKNFEVTDVNLAPNAISVKSTGTEGMLIEITDGIRNISRDFYAPQPAVVMKGIVKVSQ
ncbi:VanW family protein [Paenibacillus dokdonensis]|uniref:VanW family protein n=1 Tax=Paenibacillus dokdonensis TaxID=2567944 RepID=UPI0010A85EF4|nr:VanW family protein [Paenibacillus dokdonensis]